jgi:hypothetical protein
MGCAAIGSAMGSILPFSPTIALAVTITVGSLLAFLAFVPVFMSQFRTGARAP